MPLVSKFLRQLLVLATLVCVALGAGPPTRIVRVTPLHPASVLRAQAPDADFIVLRRNAPADATRALDHVPLLAVLPGFAWHAATAGSFAPAGVTAGPDRPSRLFIAHPRARAPPRPGSLA